MGLSARELRWMLVRLLPVLALMLLVSVILDPGGLNGDEGPLIAAAHRLLHGQYALVTSMVGTNFLWHGPGLPALIAPLIAVGAPLEALRLTSPLLMFAAAVLFYRMLRLRLGRRGALLGAYALGLYFPGYYVLGTVAKDPLALLLSIVTLDASARYIRWGRRRHAVVGGLALAALAMTRLEYGWVITLALTAGIVWWLVARISGRDGTAGAQTARRWTLICALAMLGCVPWLIYTYSLTGHVLYWGNSGGLSLYWMSSPSPSQLGQWYSAHTVASNPALAGYRPFFHYLSTLRPLQADLKLQHVAEAQALAHPAKFALNLLANLGRMFVGYPFGFVLSSALIAGMIAINGTLFAGLFAAARRVARARVTLPRETVPFLLFATIGFLVHLLPTAEPRLLIPLLPVPIWLIAQAFSARAPVKATQPAPQMAGVFVGADGARRARAAAGTGHGPGAPSGAGTGAAAELPVQP